MSYQIKHYWTDAVLYASEVADSVRDAILEYIKSGANLRGANLRGANLRDADLSGAYLRGAYLRGANLRDANLRGADLRGAYLRGANLRGANLRDANLSSADLRGAYLRDADLRGANLRDANLSSADLSGADLRDANLSSADLRDANLSSADLSGADLSGADLRGADLTPVRDDLWAVLSSAPAEVVGLRAAIAEGRIDGSTYSGKCACLVGTLANVRHCDVNSIPGLTPNSHRPIERFFMAINPGDTPEKSQFAALAMEWTDQWLANMRSAFGGQK